MRHSSRRSRRHRNPAVEKENQKPFFSRTNDTSLQATEHQAFFQPKLKIGRSGDQYEQEADQMADAVVNHSGDKQGAVQKKALGIQKKDESLIEKDKEIQEKPEIQRMGEEEKMEGELQMQKEEELEGELQMQEEEEMEGGLQKQEEEEIEGGMEMEEEMEGDLQMQEEEEMEGELQMQEEEEMEGELQTKNDTHQPARTATPQLSQRIKSSAGNGQKMTPQTRAEMESNFGFDFSDVHIHTDAEAVQMTKQLGAQAFTHGKDVYFNSGKYDPDSSSGKHLLAHELTHVIQQGGKKKSIQKKGGTAAAEKEVAAKNPYYISFVHDAPPAIDHSQANPGPQNTPAQRAGYAFMRLKPRMTVAWDHKNIEGNDQEVALFIRSANIYFTLSEAKVYVSSDYAEESCPYRVTSAHEYRHIYNFIRIFRNHRQTMVKAANAIPLPTEQNPITVKSSSMEAEQEKTIAPLVAAIKKVQATMKADMLADRHSMDAPAAYAKEYQKCPAADWKTNSK